MNRRTYLALTAGGVPLISGCPGFQQSESNTSTGSIRTPATDTPARQNTAATPPGETPSQTEPGPTSTPIQRLPSPLAVDNTNPFVYLNDIPTDNFNGELALAMASDSDGVQLEGYLHEFPNVPWWDSKEKQTKAENRYANHHRIIRKKAAESGFTDLPPAETGVSSRHTKPQSEAIDETAPIGSAATDRIVAAANAASRENPLVIAAGGPLCSVADAYLTDPSIVDKVVVFCRIRPAIDGWNEFLSGWSLTIVTRKFQTVFCPASGGPLIKKSRVRNALPEKPLREYMLSKEYDGTGKNPLADGQKWEGDAVSILSGAHPSTRTGAVNLEFAGLKEHWALGEVLPSYNETTEETNTRVIPDHHHQPMNSAWWNHMTAASTWGRDSEATE